MAAAHGVTRRPPGRAELASLLLEIGVQPSRALGQNFVTDPSLVERIARLAGVGPGDRVLEIGAGLGSLTEGQRVSFDVTTERGKQAATNLKAG